MVLASTLSAVIVSFFGTIAFIGLLGPHIARRLFGGDHRFLLLASPLTGALILLAADTTARTLLAPMILPVGILTSLLGGPLFIYLLIAGRTR
jgi:iron complex transport system permease protein